MSCHVLSCFNVTSLVSSQVYYVPFPASGGKGGYLEQTQGKPTGQNIPRRYLIKSLNSIVEKWCMGHHGAILLSQVRAPEPKTSKNLLKPCREERRVRFRRAAAMQSEESIIIIVSIQWAFGMVWYGGSDGEVDRKCDAEGYKNGVTCECKQYAKINSTHTHTHTPRTSMKLVRIQYTATWS